VVEKLVPVPEDGLPPVVVHANMIGRVPPALVALQDTAMPTVPFGGQLIVIDIVNGLIVTVSESFAVRETSSVNVTLIV